jgi:Omp85 superfamily domain
MRIFAIAVVIWILTTCIPSAQSQETNPSAAKESGQEKGASNSTGVRTDFHVAVAPTTSLTNPGPEQRPPDSTLASCNFVCAPAETGSGQEVTPPPPKAADQSAQSTAPAQPETKEEKNKKKQGGRGAFVAAPIPLSSPAIGSGAVLVAGYIFPFSKADKVSPPSVIGAAGLFTNNGTRAFGLGGQLYLKQDTYQIKAAFIHGNINYDLYGSGIFTGLKLPLIQTGEAFLGEFLRRIGWKFFLGPRFLTGHSILTLNTSSSPIPTPPDLGLQTSLRAIGARLTRDTSLNRFYPTNGTFFTFTSDFFSQTLGSKFSFQSFRASFAKYWGLSPKQVLAYNANFCATSGSPPFYGNCIYGSNNQLRGYIAGKYFDRYMLATQLEYRLALPMRFGIVAFGGVGEVIPGGDQLLFTNNSFLPSGGGGLRFNLSTKHHVNLRADIARGKDGHTFSMGIGEAF